MKACRAIAFVVASAVAAIATSQQLVAAKKFASNHFLGTCLTKEWVKSMEQSLGVDSSSRDALGRLEHPFLHAALSQPVYSVHDPRTAREGVYAGDCVTSKTRFYGRGAKVDNVTGAVLDPGIVNGSIVLEINDWNTHALTSLVFSIVAAEVYGFSVAHYAADATEPMTQRMSSVSAGYCTPTHLNLEVWTAGNKPALLMYRNETYVAGDVGYEGRSGLYTTADFVNEQMSKTPALYADFWKGYRFDEKLIEAVPESALRKNTAFFPPKDKSVDPPKEVFYCKDGAFGCKDHCSKTVACKEREAKNKECVVVAMMVDYFDPGYLQAVVNNIGIPAYFCFIGYSGMQNYALDAFDKQRPVLFYHYEPDLFHIEHPGKFQRVFLPRPVPERVVATTGLFGGVYDPNTMNPVDVDFPATKLIKYAAKVLQNQLDSPLGQFVAKFSLTELHLNDLLRKFRDQSAVPNVEDATFGAACAWVRENYDEWIKWLDRAPLCSFDAHVTYEVSGCETENATDSRRTVTFAWRHADPANASLPYDCDGGLRALPAPIATSRSCTWIRSDPSKWRSWIRDKPPCDASFYKYNITGCDPQAKRTVKYWWLLPLPGDASKSLECDGGEKLPSDVLVDCDYMPTEAPVFVGMLVIALVVTGILLVSSVVVVRFRDRPIIKRSQWEFLLLVILGGMLMCVAALIYAGEPSDVLCGARPAVASGAFTIIFGSLFVKSLRVYRVFMKSAFKRATVSSVMMAKVLVGLVVVDVVIIGVWFAVDYPKPTITISPAKEFRGDVDHISCTSESFIFSALLIFWKSIVLFMGLYASFLVRNVSTDFQESIWMFASSMMVLVGCLVILPLAYLVEMAASAFYVFLAGCLLVCTSLVMAFMLVPKFTRLQAEATSSMLSSKYSSQTTLSVKPSRRESGQIQIKPVASSGIVSESTMVGTSH